MNIDRALFGLIGPVIMSALIVPSAVAAENKEDSDEWRQRVLIYGWFPSVDGTLNFDIPGTGGSASADASELVDKLQGVFMGTYEARKQKWSFLGDVIYLNLSNSDNKAASVPGGPGVGQVTVGAKQDMKAWVVGFYGGYNVHQSEKLSTDIIAGARYLSVDVDAKLDIAGPLPPTLPSIKLSESVSLWDAIIGVRGKATVNDKWYLPYHLDIGAGGSDLTWQALAGVGYRFNSWGDVILAYRHLEYDQGKKDLLQDVSFSGPALGLNIRF